MKEKEISISAKIDAAKGYDPFACFVGSTTDELLKRGAAAEESEEIDILTTLKEEVDSDCDGKGRRLIGLYFFANERERAVMDTLLVEICGWTMASLLKRALGEDPEG